MSVCLTDPSLFPQRWMARYKKKHGIILDLCYR